ncbi:MAG: DinB family protein [Anaerolineae bacterium]
MRDKKYLLDLLTKTHATAQTALAGIDLEMPVYTDTGWRIRDIIGHIATWDRQAAMSIRAFRDGTEYAIPDLDEDAFNQQAVMAQRALTAQQVTVEWEEARAAFKKAVREIPDTQFPGDLLYPWGDERGALAQLVEFMCEHDVEHQEEIVKAIQSSHED